MSAVVDRHDYPACINCDSYFGRNDARCWFGAGPGEVGPFCEKCNGTIQVHAARDAAAVNAFHAHLDGCSRCAKNPFGLCPEGASALLAIALTP